MNQQTLSRVGVLRSALALLLILGSASVRAQLVVEPQDFSVSVPQGETVTRTVTLTNAGSEALTFCLSFDRPLQREGERLRLSAEALGEACGEYGEVLALIDRDDLPGCCASAAGLTMTPDGQIFAARYGQNLTYVLDAALGFVRVFEHPIVAELAPFPVTTGVTYKTDIGTLWWLNIEEDQSGIQRALLLEGDLDGVATGRWIELPIGVDLPEDERVYPTGLAYDAATALFYYIDGRGDAVWGVDTLGAVAEGYPTALETYPDANLTRGLDAYSLDSGTSPEERAALRIEAMAIPVQQGRWQLVVKNAFGRDAAPGAEPLETPLPPLNPNTEPGVVNGEPVRSRLDPNGVLYYPWATFENSGVLAIRPHPLPPSWLVVEAWDGTLAPGESRTLELTFRPGQRSVGDYTATLQAFTAATGEAVEVPLSLTVTQEVGAEDEIVEPETSSLAVYPNPSAARSTVAFTLATASDARVAVYDVLGREVAVLHAGPLAAGAHAFSLDGRALPSGVYLVRVAAGTQRFTERVTVVR